MHQKKKTNSNAKNPSLLTITDTMDFSNRSKQHANKFHKNQQQKSQEQLPQPKQTTATTPTTTLIASIPSTTPNNPTSSHPQTEILFNVTPQRNNIKSETSNSSPIPINRQKQKPSSLGASSLQSLEDIETISDESQNIQVTQQRDKYVTSESTTYKPKVIGYRNNEGFATSPRANLLREYTEKKVKDKTSLESAKSYDSSKASEEYGSRSTERQQIKHLQSFVLSDVQPQSFKPAPVFENEDEISNESNASLEHESSSASTTLRNTAILDPKPFQYSLQTGANGFNLQIKNNPSSNSEELTQTYYSKPDTQIFTMSTARNSITSTTRLITTTTTTTTPPSTTTTTTTRRSTTPLLTTVAPITH